MINKIHNQDCLTGLKALPDNYVDCCVTSPPYYGLRDYGTAKWEGGNNDCDHIQSKSRNDTSTMYSDGDIMLKQFNNICGKCGATRIDSQIGLEETPEAYVNKMVEVFTEVKRVMKKEGSLWLNLGDSYNSTPNGQTKPRSEYGNKNGLLTMTTGKSMENYFEQGRQIDKSKRLKGSSIKPKDLIGIPWMVAFALRQPVYECNVCHKINHAMKWGKFPNGRLICPICELSKGHTVAENGWYLRQDIIWNKPNPMPESVTDRCTKAHEYIFLLSKSAKYYYDGEAIQELDNYDGRKDIIMKGSEKYQNGFYPTDVKTQSIALKGHERWKFKTKSTFGNRNGELDKLHSGKEWNVQTNNEMFAVRNKRSVWTVPTKPYNEAHFATFPPALIIDCIKAGCPVDGIVLDPFMGAGTTALVASKLNRNYIGFELNEQYIKIANNRLRNELGMFNKSTL